VALFRELLRYVHASTFRHDFILRYFGEKPNLAVCAGASLSHIDRVMKTSLPGCEKTTIIRQHSLASLAPGQGRCRPLPTCCAASRATASCVRVRRAFLLSASLRLRVTTSSCAFCRRDIGAGFVDPHGGLSDAV